MTTISDEKVNVPGKKPTALFFFSVGSVGCGECAGGAQSLATAGQALDGKANVLAVDMDPSESAQTIRQFLHYNKATDVLAAIDKNIALSRSTRSPHCPR